jgi:cytochrome c-type biogenesis protein CcsB
MPSADLANVSETLVWLAVVAYAAAAALSGFEFAYRVAWVGRAAVAVTVAGLGANVAAAVTRGLATHRVPWGNMYEYSIMVGVVTVAAYLVWVARRPEVRPLGMFILLPAVLAIAIGGVALRVPAGPLVPALNSGWIKIHVAAAITGSSILCLGGIFSLLYLAKERYERRTATPAPPLVAGGARTADRVELRETLAAYVEEEEAAPEAPAPAPTTAAGGATGAGALRIGRLLELLPASRTLDMLAYRTAAFGFPIWTFAIIAGAIWAQSAWGRYWGWDPKEVWSLVAFLAYMAILHGRWDRFIGMFGVAAISIIAFQTILMTYLGVNFVLTTGLHSYGMGDSPVVTWMMIVAVVEIAFLAWGLVAQRRLDRAELATL